MFLIYIYIIYIYMWFIMSYHCQVGHEGSATNRTPWHSPMGAPALPFWRWWEDLLRRSSLAKAADSMAFCSKSLPWHKTWLTQCLLMFAGVSAVSHDIPPISYVFDRQTPDTPQPSLWKRRWVEQSRPFRARVFPYLAASPVLFIHPPMPKSTLPLR